MENVKEAPQKASEGTLCLGTIDSYLVYRLTGGASFKTDYSNASRTQLFNIHSLEWDEAQCEIITLTDEELQAMSDACRQPCLDLYIESNGEAGQKILDAFNADIEKLN